MIADKHILITGANGGIGFAITKLLVKQKAKLTLLYHENNQNIEKLKNESRKRGYSFITGMIDPANKQSMFHYKLGWEAIFRIHFSSEIIQDVTIFTFNRRGKIVKSFLGIFNNILGMSILACLLKIFKSIFPLIINYNEKIIPDANLTYIIKNFEKIQNHPIT